VSVTDRRLRPGPLSLQLGGNQPRDRVDRQLGLTILEGLVIAADEAIE
jgi:hypothetical protein